MKWGIKKHLTINAVWKKLTKEEEEKLSLVDLDIIVYEKKDSKVFFEASIIYRLKDDIQKQTFASGVALINEVGNVIKVCSPANLSM